MKTIILNQRKERDELMSRLYLIRKSIQMYVVDNGFVASKAFSLSDNHRILNIWMS